MHKYERGEWKEDANHINWVSTTLNIKILLKQSTWIKIGSNNPEQNGQSNKAFEFQNFASSWLQCNGFLYKTEITVIQDMFYWLEIKKLVRKARLGRNDTFKSLYSSWD